MPFHYVTVSTLRHPVLEAKANVSLDFLNKSVLEKEKKSNVKTKLLSIMSSIQYPFSLRLEGRLLVFYWCREIHSPNDTRDTKHLHIQPSYFTKS